MKISTRNKKLRTQLGNQLRLELLENRDVPSTFSGTVFNDANSNGVLDAGEQGLAGWTLFVDVNRNSIADSNETSTVTDANGHYFFDTTNEPPAIFVASNGTIYDFVGLDLQVGSGGRWVNTNATFAVAKRNLEPDAVRDFGVNFHPYDNYQPAGPESLVNATVAGQQGPGTGLQTGTQTMTVAADAAGNYVVAWRTFGGSGTDTISARVFNADGSARTGEFTVATVSSLDPGMPEVAMAGNGKFLVTWTSLVSSPGGTSVLARAYNSDGTAAGPTVTLVAGNSRSGGSVWGAAADSTGNFVVLYTSSKLTDSTATVKFQRLTATGSALGGATTVVTPNLINGEKSIAMDGAGNLVVVWDDTISTTSGITHYVYAQRYSASGRKTGSQITVASAPANPGGVWQSSVGMNADGRFVVAWHERVSGNKFARAFNADGTASAGAVLITSGVQYESPAGVAVDSAGNATFAWTDNRQPSLPTPGALYSYDVGEVRLSRLAVGASSAEPEMIANTTTQGIQTLPGVAATGSGSFVVVWQGYGPGDDQGIFSQRFAPPPAPLMAASLPAGSPSSQTISISAVNPLLNEAIRRWEVLGVSPSALHGIDVRIGDLGGATLGLASGRSITLDDNAAGWGWFVDKTARSDSEFTKPGNQGEQNRMDLLTVLMHEMGHVLGYEHTATPGSLMNETLAAGTRENPETELVTQESVWGALIAQAQMKKQKSLFRSFLAGTE